MCCPVDHPRLPAAIRLNDNGTLDSTFGVGGITTYSLGFDDFAPGSAVFSSNRLLIVGSAYNSGSFNTNTVALTLGGQGTTNLTYSAQWQVLVETPTIAINTTFDQVTHVWSPLYVDGLVGSDIRAHVYAPYQVLGQTYYYTSVILHTRSFVRADANWNVTSLLRANAAVSPVFTTVERYEYDPYGSVTYLSGSFGVLTAVGGSSYGQKYLHQGGRLDEVTGLYSFRFREYDPMQGRWKQADPAGYVDGISTYQYLAGAPLFGLDPSGLWKISVNFNAFIDGRLGNWLKEPGSVRPVEFSSSQRTFGQFNFSKTTPNSKLSSDVWIDSEKIGKAAAFGVDYGGGTSSGVSEQREWGPPIPQRDGPPKREIVSRRTAIAPVKGGKPSVTNGKCTSTITVAASATYPFAFSLLTPSIDYEVTVVFTVIIDGVVDVKVDASHNEFPSYESYVNGSLITSYTPAGTGPGFINLSSSDSSAGRKLVVGVPTPSDCCSKPLR